MIKQPIFSIIVVTFNSAKTLEKCFLSLRRQTFGNWELVVVDGSSTDDTIKIIQKYRQMISYFVSEKDSGIYDAMNKAVAKAKGEFLYFLNSDDEFHDENVLRDVSKVIDEKTELLTANVVKKYENYSIIKKNKLIKSNLRKGLMPSHQSMFLRKSLFNVIGGFNESYKSSGDFDLCCKLFRFKVKTDYFDRNIAFFSYGGVSSNKKIAYSETFLIIKKYFGKYFAMIFYLKKIFIEQNIKKLIKLLP